MTTAIPYSPNLVLGNIVDKEAMDTILEIAKETAPIESAKDTLNSFISLKRSLDMTVQELINMQMDPKDLIKKVADVGVQVDTAAKEYGKVQIAQQRKLQPLRGKLRLVNAPLESPIDYNRCSFKLMPLAADSIKIDAQYFSFDKNDQNISNTLSHIKDYVSGATSVLGNEKSFHMAETVAKQTQKQKQTHDIEGTLLITASCTHKMATLLSPLFLDPDKAMRAWNALYPNDKLRIKEEDLEAALKQSGTEEERAMHIISGFTTGSSFVGMVHILRQEFTDSSESAASDALDMAAQIKVGLIGSGMAGGFGFAGGGGLTGSFSESMKRLLSKTSINAHVSLVTAGFIPTIMAKPVKIGVKKFASFDPKADMEELLKLDNFTQNQIATLQASATAARTKGEFVSLKTATITSVIGGLAAMEQEANSMLDINSMMEAFNDYILAATEDQAGKETTGTIGVPINYMLKPITKLQIAQLWVNKYFPGKYKAFQGDDAAVPPPAQPGAEATPAQS
jgi:uncharacterized protein (UPF0254 family)